MFEKIEMVQIIIESKERNNIEILFIYKKIEL
jgi:hypothetical protein